MRITVGIPVKSIKVPIKIEKSEKKCKYLLWSWDSEVFWHLWWVFYLMWPFWGLRAKSLFSWKCIIAFSAFVYSQLKNCVLVQHFGHKLYLGNGVSLKIQRNTNLLQYECKIEDYRWHLHVYIWYKPKGAPTYV